MNLESCPTCRERVPWGVSTCQHCGSSLKSAERIGLEMGLLGLLGIGAALVLAAVTDSAWLSLGAGSVITLLLCLRYSRFVERNLRR